MNNEARKSYSEVKTRLDEIVDAVSVEDISLDDALDLYEEAVKLGMQVGDLIEEDISAEEAGQSAEASDAQVGDMREPLEPALTIDAQHEEGIETASAEA